MPSVGLQLHDEVQDLRLHADVERADRLVRDDELGVQRQRAGDRDALALAARQLVRIAAHEAARQVHPVEELRDALADRGALGQPVVADRLRHLVDQLHLRVERGERVLKDHLHLAPRPAQRARRHRDHVLAVEADLARQRLDQAQDRAAAGRLAAARFADERERLALADVERHVLDRVHPRHRPAEEPSLDRKARGQVAHLDDVAVLGHLDRPGDVFRRAEADASARARTCRASRRAWARRRAATWCSRASGSRRCRRPAPPRPCGRGT